MNKSEQREKIYREYFIYRIISAFVVVGLMTYVITRMILAGAMNNIWHALWILWVIGVMSALIFLLIRDVGRYQGEQIKEGNKQEAIGD